MKTSSVSMLAIATTMLLGACSTTKMADAPMANQAMVTPMPAAADPRTVATVTTVSIDPLNDAKGMLARRSVYFDYDSYGVKDEFKPVLDAHSRYLASHQARHILIQGNTDERGGSEYNLALGQKRAEAVRKSLQLMGVPANQMEAVSYGKEKPKAAGHDEAAYAENRRDDIVY